MNPALYEHPVERFDVIETHISWVLLTGLYAYKIKKPVNLGFLDFSTLEKRRFYCGEELRLNRRLAPQLYLDVVPITGSLNSPTFYGTGPVVECAVKMKQFAQDAQLDRVLARGEIRLEQIDALAHELADFHSRAAIAGEDSPFGTPERVLIPIQENFKQLRDRITDRSDLTQLDHLQAWSEEDHAVHHEDFLERKRRGYIRECHGDLHSGNMVLLDGRIVIFDCLEFNDNLRWIDVLNDVAFLIMDLDHRGHPELARRFLNAYLEGSGDYAGLPVLCSYQVYRAMVRAKVACIRLHQAETGGQDQQQLWQEYRSDIDLAYRYTRPARVFLVITHGLSGSGKTTLAQSVVEATGAVRLRSDVERKRLYGLSPLMRTATGLGSGLYNPEASKRTYEKLADLAGIILRAGYPAIVDGAFLKRVQRDTLRNVAEQLQVPFVILDVQTPEAVLRGRIIQREQEGTDASEASLDVLNHQLSTQEPLGPDEDAHVLRVPMGCQIDLTPIISVLNQMT
jgi:hypothetical protein